MGAVVQSNSAFNAAAGTTLGVTTGSAVVAGRYLWVVVNSDDATCTVADTLGNTYTERGSVNEPAILQRLHHFTAPITTAGTPTITATFGASVANRFIAYYEVSSVGAFDVQNTGTDNGNNPTLSVSATNTAQPAFMLSAAMDLQGVLLAAGTGQTDLGFFSSGSDGLRAQSKALTTIGSQSVNFSNPGVDRTTTVLAIFTDSASAPNTAYCASSDLYF